MTDQVKSKLPDIRLLNQLFLELYSNYGLFGNQSAANICQFANHPIGFNRIIEPRLGPSFINSNFDRTITNEFTKLIK